MALRERLTPRRSDGAEAGSSGAPPLLPSSPRGGEGPVDLAHRRDELQARVAELQLDLGGLVYEMVIRDRIRVEVLVQRAAELQDADAELSRSSAS